MKMPIVDIAEAASKDGYRPILNAVFFDAVHSRIVASDGFLLSVLPVVVESGDVSAVIPLKEWEEAFAWEKKAAKRTGTIWIGISPNILHCYSADADVFYEPVDGTYPDVDSIIAKLRPEDDESPVLAIDTSVIKRMAESLFEAGEKKKYVYMYSRKRNGDIGGLYVKHLDTSTGRFGVVMTVNTHQPTPSLSDLIVDAIRSSRPGVDTDEINRQARHVLEKLHYKAPANIQENRE